MRGRDIADDFDARRLRDDDRVAAVMREDGSAGLVESKPLAARIE